MEGIEPGRRMRCKEGWRGRSEVKGGCVVT